MVKQRKKKEVLIIIPAYNEGKTIGALLEQLKQPEIAEFADVLVMNDASKDNTAQVVREHGHTVVTHVFNLGYGSGLQLGYKYAERNGYEYIIQMDADGQHDVCNVSALYQKLKTPDAQGKYPDIVLGSRFLDGSVSFPVSALKKLAFALFRCLIKFGTGKKIMDPTTGLQGLSRRAFSFYSTYGHFDDKYPDANMIMQMLMLGFRIEEIPAVMHARTEGVSMHSGLKPVIYMFRMMFSIIAVWVRIRIYKVDMGATDEEAFE
ncbi:MAG: glycosyltransferase family 2 protein [Lachnospiraceae bacterium]|nr:glycosyltransferase family 2 protein [Lachnospiraceae bacterium]